MSEPTPLNDFTRRPRVTARCKRCHRDFVTMPLDHKDHYPPKDWAIRPVNGECGGDVVSIPTL